MVDNSNLQNPISLAGSSDVSVDTLRRLATSKDSYVRENVAENPVTPPEILALMVKREKISSLTVRKALAGNPNTPGNMLARLAGVSFRLGSFFVFGGRPYSGAVVDCVARNPSTPSWVLEFLMFRGSKLGFAPDTHMYMSSLISQNPNCPEKLLKQFADCDEYWIRCHVARNPSTSPELLRKLSFDTYVDVRVAIADRSDVSSEMLSWLACSDEPLILSSVASNPNASPNLLYHLLVTCHDPTIQSEIMGNPTYVAYQRGLVLADLEMEEGLLSSEMIDEIWRG